MKNKGSNVVSVRIHCKPHNFALVEESKCIPKGVSKFWPFVFGTTPFLEREEEEKKDCYFHCYTLKTSAREGFGHIESVKILVILNSTGGLYVYIFRFCFHSLEVYSVHSPKMIGNSPKVSNFN